MEDRILIVDDDRSIHKVMEMILRDSFDLMFVEDAKKALDLIFFNGKTFDLILLDIVMPKMDGLELLKRVKAVNPVIPGIMITGYPEVETVVEAMRAGACDFIIKPPDLDSVTLSVKRALDRRRAVQEDRI